MLNSIMNIASPLLISFGIVLVLCILLDANHLILKQIKNFITGKENETYGK
jgi:hypothetical protein